jgi:hypothetical protein
MNAPSRLSVTFIAHIHVYLSPLEADFSVHDRKMLHAMLTRDYSFGEGLPKLPGLSDPFQVKVLSLCLLSKWFHYNFLEPELFYTYYSDSSSRRSLIEWQTLLLVALVEMCRCWSPRCCSTDNGNRHLPPSRCAVPN